MTNPKTNKGDSDDWGSWEQAEQWSRQSFKNRSPLQRLRWLKSALVIAYQSGALEISGVTPEADSARDCAQDWQP